MNIKKLFAVIAASAVALTSVAVSAAAQTPFKGRVSAVESVVVTPPTASIIREGTGTATYLGRFTEHVVLTVDLPTMSSRGSATFTAANGDTLTASVVGQATRTGPTTLSIVEIYNVTGGTGRFAGSSGSFTLESSADQASGASSGTLSGAIDH
jgi:hypothetical protein